MVADVGMKPVPRTVTTSPLEARSVVFDTVTAGTVGSAARAGIASPTTDSAAMRALTTKVASARWRRSGVEITKDSRSGWPGLPRGVF